MIVTGYLIMEPGADRPYFCHKPPVSYEKKEGAKVFIFSVLVPDFVTVDGRIAPTRALQQSGENTDAADVRFP